MMLIGSCNLVIYTYTNEHGHDDMKSIDLGNNEKISRGMIEVDGGFLALTFTQSKNFKNRAAAVKWLAKRGVIVS